MRKPGNAVREEVLLAASHALVTVLRDPEGMPTLPPHALASLRLLEAALEAYSDR